MEEPAVAGKGTAACFIGDDDFFAACFREGHEKRGVAHLDSRADRVKRNGSQLVADGQMRQDVSAGELNAVEDDQPVELELVFGSKVRAAGGQAVTAGGWCQSR